MHLIYTEDIYRLRKLVLILTLLAAPGGLVAQQGPFVTFKPGPPAFSEGIDAGRAISKTMFDPVYATLYGGNNYDELLAQAVSKKHACVVGVTSSTDLLLFAPIQDTLSGSFDGWIGCGDAATGVPYMATYFGSTGAETITDVAILGDTVFTVGVTTSNLLPGAANAYQDTLSGTQDCFIARMSVFDGAGLQTTFFGGDSEEFCSGIAVGPRGVWIGGTTSGGVDVVNPLQAEFKGAADGFFSLFDLGLQNLRFSTHIGGDNVDGIEALRMAYLKKDQAEKFDDAETPETFGRIAVTGWSDGPGLPVTDDAHQPNHAGGNDAFLGTYIADYGTGEVDWEYVSYAGGPGLEVGLDLSLTARFVGVTGWTTSPDWQTRGRPRITGASDGFLYFEVLDDTSGPEISYVGPSTFYNLPLAIDVTRPGITAVGGFTSISSLGNAFLEAYDQDFNLLGNEFSGGNAAADCNSVLITPEFWACGGKTGGPIQTTPLAIQSDYGGGDFDMFGSKYRTPWSYSFFFNATDQELSVERNGEERPRIPSRWLGRYEPLPWNKEVNYTLSTSQRTYSVDRFFNPESPLLTYTYFFPESALTVQPPAVPAGKVAILAYNELGRNVDVIRTDQTPDHNEISRTQVEAGQFFFIPLDRDQNVRIDDGSGFIDYTVPKKKFYSEFPYFAGILEAALAPGSVGPGFALVLFNPLGQPFETPVTTARERGLEIPTTAGIRALYPNPFRSTVTLEYDVQDAQHVKLDVFDVTGRRVRTLVDGFQPAGAMRAEWNGRDEAGRHVASGTYLFRLEVAGTIQTKAAVVLR